MNFRIGLSIILLIISIMLVREKNNLKLIIFFSVFSTIAASLYYFNAAPDVALAELSIGSAFIPLIFLITVSKQRTFTVVADYKSLHFCTPSDDERHPGVCFPLLEEFCSLYDLKLQIITPDIHEAQTVLGAFRSQNIDLIIKYEEENNDYYFIGKNTNIMMNRLESLTQKFENISVLKVKDYETED